MALTRQAWTFTCCWDRLRLRLLAMILAACGMATCHAAAPSSLTCICAALSHHQRTQLGFGKSDSSVRRWRDGGGAMLDGLEFSQLPACWLPEVVATWMQCQPGSRMQLLPLPLPIAPEPRSQ